MTFDLETRHCEGGGCTVRFRVLPASTQRLCLACAVKAGQATRAFRPTNGKKTPPVRPAK